MVTLIYAQNESMSGLWVALLRKQRRSAPDDGSPSRKTRSRVILCASTNSRSRTSKRTCQPPRDSPGRIPSSARPVAVTPPRARLPARTNHLPIDVVSLPVHRRLTHTLRRYRRSRPDAGPSTAASSPEPRMSAPSSKVHLPSPAVGITARWCSRIRPRRRGEVKDGPCSTWATGPLIPSVWARSSASSNGSWTGCWRTEVARGQGRDHRPGGGSRALARRLVVERMLETTPWTRCAWWGT